MIQPPITEQKTFVEQIKVLMLPFLMNGSCIGKRSKYNADKKVQFSLHYCRILSIAFSFSIVVPKNCQIHCYLTHSACLSSINIKISISRCLSIDIFDRYLLKKERLDHTRQDLAIISKRPNSIFVFVCPFIPPSKSIVAYGKLYLILHVNPIYHMRQC